MKASSKGVRFFLELGLGILSIIVGIIFFILDANIMQNVQFADNSYFTLIFLILAGAASIADAFLGLPFIGIASSVLFGVGLGNHLRLACYPLADLSAPVAFFTGSVPKAQLPIRFIIHIRKIPVTRKPDRQ